MLGRGVGNMINDFDIAKENNHNSSRIKMLLKYQGGNYVLKTSIGDFEGRTYFECLWKYAKAPIPIGLAKADYKTKLEWVEGELREQGKW